MSRSRSPASLRSWARTASTSSAIRRSLNSPIEKTLSHRSQLLAERFEVFLRRARQKIEERVETTVERAAQLRDGAVERVKRQAGGRPVSQLQRRFLDALQRAFRDEPDPVHERISRHAGDCTSA